MDAGTRYRGTAVKVARHEVTTRMPKDVADAARTRARALGMSLNDYIVGLVEYDLARAGDPGSRLRIQAEQLLRTAIAEVLEEEGAVKAS